MENQKNFRKIPDDHAMKLELIIKTYGLTEAEEYFRILTDSAAKKAACLPLLRGYVRDRDTGKAETFMVKLYELGLVVGPHPYNEMMMKLYMATHDYRKVPHVIHQIKRNKVPCNVLSYNLWMSACGEGEGYGVAAVETAFGVMQNDENVEVGWSSLAILANVYMKSGQSDKAILVLKNAEKKLTFGCLGYFFLITIYASLKEKEGVLRLWEASKAVGGRISCANYIGIISCLVKLEDIVQVKRIFMEWESNCRKYDIRVSNVLLGAYVRNGLMEEAESLHIHTLQKGGCPYYKTWEILIEGYVNKQRMDEAMLKNCHWRPPHKLVLAIAEYLEEHENFEYAKEFIIDIHNLGLGTLSLYKILLRMHLFANKPPVYILKMMDEDKVERDDETLSIIKAFTGLKYLEV